ncbi:MAG: tRNA uridine-5-carboxymethylaminomethyl(34) synthesis GTPase MnmE [Lachnospiraceae bacterium]|nr:tRNA uridine-5-carboxymethylaminomethyl(34) synthesis GTPase MnmE [Lachnospiraceae bacterium]
MLYKNDTIAAIATGASNAGIGIIRISGEHALEVADRCFRAKNPNKKIITTPGYHAVYGNVTDGDVVMDEAVCLVMRAPNSYTTEDVVEVQCHGGTIQLRQILKVILKNGARVAEPGEFTKRAYLGGRIDITQAESVMDMICAQNELAARSSAAQLQGALSDKIREIRSFVLENVAYIESALDDPENYSLDGFSEELYQQVEATSSEVLKLLGTAEEGKMIREGIRTVILGKPNAGKSSFLNQLLGEERAIVTEIAGTTRDTLEEEVMVQGIPLKIIDTAGIHETVDIVEKLGVEKAKKSLEDADLVVYIVDGSRVLDQDDAYIMKLLQDRKVIILINKIDVEQVVDKSWITANIIAPMIEISAKTGEGLQEFKEELTKMFFHGKLSFNDQVYITNLRHREALSEADLSLKRVLDSIRAGMPEDFLTIDLMAAYEQLGTILGEQPEDDLANEIFSKFCMGK